MVDDIIEKRKPPTTLIDEGFEKKIGLRYLQQNKESEYKRKQAPLGLRVTSSIWSRKTVSNREQFLMFKPLKLGIILLIIVQSIYSQSKTIPSEFWNNYTLVEK